MSSTQALNIRLCFQDADVSRRDPARVTTVALKSIEALEKAGYKVTPTYTGAKGGLLFEVVCGLAVSMYKNKDVLIALAGLATPIVTYFLNKKKSREEKDSPPSLVITINDAIRTIPIHGEMSDNQLLEHLMSFIPDLPEPITPQTGIRIDVHIPSPPSFPPPSEHR